MLQAHSVILMLPYTIYVPEQSNHILYHSHQILKLGLQKFGFILQTATLIITLADSVDVFSTRWFDTTVAFIFV